MRLENFPLPEQKEDKKIEKKFDDRILEKLNPVMAETAEALRFEGFAVDDYLQAEPSAFGAIFDKKEIDSDQKKTWALEEEFLKDKFKEFSESGITPELLEIAVPIGFNKGWAGDRFTAIRAARFDDIFNGVDAFLIDRETGLAVAAIDITADIKKKINNPKIQKRITNGCKIKYGFGLDKDGAYLRSYEKLPLIFISLTKKQLEEGVEDFTSLDGEIIQTLRSQASALKHLPQIKGLIDRDVDKAYRDLYAKL